MFGPPRRLKDRYATQRPLRRGRSISVYQAVDLQQGNRPCLVHQVALTGLETGRREQLEYRFLQEAAAWQTRQHPNILRILDADVQHQRLYLITDPIKGTSLRSLIADRRQVIPEPTMIEWADQVLGALEYLHSLDPPVVLGCLSPASIHVDSEGHLQLTEVGLLRHRLSGLLRPARGVPGYAAPEQRKGKVLPLSDLYSLAIILYQIMTRFDPKERPLPALRKHARGYSEPVVEAVSRAIRSAPDKRYPSAADLRQALRGAAPESGIELPPFELLPGRTVNSIPALIQLCASSWDDGLLALSSGRIAQWLEETAASLSQTETELTVLPIEQAAERARQARQKMVDRVASSRAAAAQEIARNAVYAAWLQEMGAIGVQPRLDVRPARFDFGVVGATIKAKSVIQLQNRGRGYLSGRVESHLPWLTVPNPVFGCRAGQSTQIQVEARGRLLPPGDSRSPQALRVLSNGGNVWIEAQATSSPPVLSVRPQTLDFGPITHGASRVAYLEVANRGGGRVNGELLSTAPYLRVRHPRFSCPAGATAQIAVELLSERLPRRAVRIRRALAVDSDSGQARIDVAWKWARPALELDLAGLDLGTVERGEPVERAITLSNSGTADLVGRASSHVDWLSIEPQEFRCAPGATQLLVVRCATRQLPGGSTVEPEAIVLEANAGTQTLSAAIQVLAPRLVVEPTEIDLGTVQDGEQAEETFVVGNRGSLPWRGRIEPTVPWLRVEPSELECEPGHMLPVSVLLDTEDLEHGGEWRVPNALQIDHDGPRQYIAVHLALSRPELTVQRHALDFGLIGKTEIASVPLEITNSGTGNLEWHTEIRGTWLEVDPPNGICGTGETQTIRVNGYALAVDGESGHAWLTLHSNAGRVDLPASVALSSPLLSVEPLALSLQSENYGAATQTLRITNRGVGTLTGTIRPGVPWLSCQPTQFQCETGAAVQIEVQAQLEDLREGRYEAVDALLVQSNGGEREIDVGLRLELTPSLHVSPADLRFKQELQSAFFIENRGYGTLRVQVLPSEPWLTVNRREWTIKARKRARVRVQLVDAPAEAQASITIRTPDQEVDLPVQCVS
jgi:serine/threonine protein kinase